MKGYITSLASYTVSAVLLLGVSGAATAGWDVKGLLDKAKETVTGTKKEEAVPEEQKEFSVAKDATTGAVICGGLAKLLGKGNDTAVKAAVACGAANAAVTILANRGKSEYAEQYQQITDDMAASEKEIESLEKETRENNKKVDDYQSEVKKLIAREKDDKKFIAKAGDLREEMDNQIRSNKKAKSKAQAKLEILDKQVADLDVIIKDSPDVEDLKKTRLALLDQKDRLTESVKQANGMNKELLAQTSELDNEIIKRS